MIEGFSPYSIAAAIVLVWYAWNAAITFEAAYETYAEVWKAPRQPTATQIVLSGILGLIWPLTIYLGQRWKREEEEKRK